MQGFISTFTISNGISITDTPLLSDAALTVKNLNSNQLLISDSITTVSATPSQPEIVIGSTAAEISSFIVPSTVTNAVLNYSQILVDEGASRTVTTNNEITVSFDTADVSGMIMFPAGVIITDSTDMWNGGLNMAQQQQTSSATLPGQTTEAVIEIGFGDSELGFSTPFKVIFDGKAGLNLFYERAGVTTTIDTICSSDFADSAAALVQLGAAGSAEPNECTLDVNSDLIMWANHNTKFGVSSPTPTTPSTSRGGSSGDRVSPSISSGFDAGEYPVSIMDSFYTTAQLQGIASTDTVNILEIGKNLQMNLLLYDNGGPNNITHVAMYVDRNGLTILNDLTETAIVWDKYDGVEILNPDEIISNGTVTFSTQNNKAAFTFDVTFAKEIEQSDVVFVAWDNKRNVMNVLVEDSLEVVLVKPITEYVRLSSSPDAEIGKHSMDQEPDIGVMMPNPQKIIKQWAGYDNHSATDADVLYSVVFESRGETADKKYNVQPWIKQHLGQWYAQEQITFEEFATALRYMYDAGKFH